jgi:hypothetical protein
VRSANDTVALGWSAKGVAGVVATIDPADASGRGSLVTGLQVDATDAAGGFRTALLTWNLAQDSSPDDTIAILRSVLGHFGVPTSGPAKLSRIAVFDPTVRQAVAGRPIPVRAIVLGTTKAPVVRYRAHGTSTWTQVAMTPGKEPGAWSAGLPSAAVTPDGLDYRIDVGQPVERVDEPPRTVAVLPA